MRDAAPETGPVVVLGGTKGLGRCVSQQLAAQGVPVVCLGRTRPAFIGTRAGTLSFRAADFEDARGFRAVLAKIKAEHAPLRGLVLAQRYRGQGDGWTGEMLAAVETSRIAFESFEGAFAPQGAVVAVSSVASQRILGDCSPGYHVAKAALEQLVRCYAVRWGRQNVRVNAVAPSVFTKEESQEYYRRETRLVRHYESITPLGRMGTAEEIARVVCFLLGPQASFMTGQVLTVDGGMSLPWADTDGRATKTTFAAA